MKLSVDSEALTVDDGARVERIPKARITRGVKVPTEHELRVHLRCERGRDRELTVPRERSADELLEELEVARRA